MSTKLSENFYKTTPASAVQRCYCWDCSIGMASHTQCIMDELGTKNSTYM